MNAREIEFGAITVDAENNHVTVTLSQDGTVWMTQTEIARLFGVFPASIRSNIRAIYKDKRMNEYRTHQITGRGDLYSLEMIAAPVVPGAAPWNPKLSGNGCFIGRNTKWSSCKSTQTIDKR